MIAWLFSHPLQAFTVLVTIGATSYIIGAAVWALALAHEAHKASEQRKTLDRIVQASMPPAAPGINRKRVS